MLCAGVEWNKIAQNRGHWWDLPKW